MLAKEYGRVKKIIQKRKFSKNSPLFFWEFFYFKFLHGLIMVFHPAESSFKFLVSGERSPLGIRFSVKKPGLAAKRDRDCFVPRNDNEAGLAAINN